MLLLHMQIQRYFNKMCDNYNNYRLMHALFRIRTVIILGEQYPPEGFSPRDDNSPEMEKGMH